MQFEPPSKSFLDLTRANYIAPAKSKAVVIPFGLEASVSYGGGTAKGPAAMIAASREVELFDDEFWCEPFEKYGVVTAKPVQIKKSLPAALAQLEGEVEKVLDMGKFPLVFGGEHAITAGAIRPYARRHKKLTVLHFDAHADLRDGYHGEHYSHAAALRRVLDHDNVSLVSVGIRNISKTEIPFFEANKDRIKIYWARQKAQWKVAEIAKRLKGRDVYITFDLDAFDASLMPATGTPEPGGLFWDETMDILRAVCKTAHIVGADINELAPSKGLHACDFLAARLAYRILSYKFLL
jgi:agmatinase